MSAMRVLVDGLSATSYSGRHVLLGHLEQLAAVAPREHEFFVIYHPSNTGLRRLSATNVHWIAVPEAVRDWKRRAIWQMLSLRKTIRATQADLLFNPNGTIFPGSPLPQVSLAQNPWCLTPALHCGLRDRSKALLQRQAYRETVKRADLLAYNSEFMRHAYRQNAAGFRERDSLIAYQGLDDETHDAAESLRNQARKQSHRILVVSVMAPWKNLETLIDALVILRRGGVPATLNIVGPWADAAYEQAIREKVAIERLANHVHITGGVTRSELYEQYAEAAVFCLLSRCESFGIPALEAQLFGTPAVVSDGCAMPEICGAGSVAVPAGDATRAATALAGLLEDSNYRHEMAQAALDNATRFRWNTCSFPLRRIFELSAVRSSRPLKTTE
jgi:glycosyltransferase involved in cell wall biosynthesis